MMSALAFGYGVGMVAPEGAIEQVRDVVHGPTSPQYRAAVQQAGPQGQPGAPYWALVSHYPAGGPYAAPPGYAASVPPPPGYAPRYAAPGAIGGHGYGVATGGESRELAKLRRTGPAGQTCRLPHDHGRASEPGRRSSGQVDGDLEDLDDEGRDALSRLQLPDFQVPITRSALKYVRFLTRTQRGRGLFQSWLKRSGRYAELIQQTMRERHLPEDLIWLAMIESGFDPRVKSPAGAVGLWQFMRGTGQVYGLEVNRFSDLRRNPKAATVAAAHHLNDLHDRFGAWDLAFAAYNMGYEQLLDRIDRYGTSDFNELARQRALPSETAAYVPKIIAAALVANNLERYGFADVKVYRPVHVAELSVPGGTPLRVLGKAAGVSTKTIRKLNPHLLTEFVPPGADFTVNVPPDSFSRARAALPRMLDTRMVMNDADILDPGDLIGLSGKKNKRLRHHAWTEDENLLRYLPKPKRRSMRQLLGKAAKTAQADPRMDVLAEEFKPKRGDRETVMYRVGPGDTLIALAKQFVVDLDDLARDNGLESDARLREGALLKVLVKRTVLKTWKKKMKQRKKTVGAPSRSKRHAG